MEVAIITGASMGLGAEFARQLAARKENLLLVARSADKLTELAEELRLKHHVKVWTLPCDLARPNAAQDVAAFLQRESLMPRWLINNAGFGLFGPLDTMDPIGIRDMMMLNMVTLVDLTRALLPEMRLLKHARIINVASTASLQPVPFFNVYAATKVFVLHFSEALSEELRGTNVSVQALCPGPTPTNFHVASGMNADVFDKGQTAADVVRMGLNGIDRGRVVIVCQRAWATLVLRLLPRALVRFAAGKIALKMMKQARE